jgi:hypothetical protein
MSDTSLARYHFVAWTRRGVATSINQPDQGSLPDRAALSVQLSISSQKGATTTVTPADPKSVEMFGPGDVIGIDPRHIIRTEPRDLTANYEPNYLCGIEFDSPDLPWLFTPAAPVGDRLRPWIALIVLKGSEFKPVDTPPNPLPAIDVSTLAPLHELADSWNWAHTQISGDTPIADALASAPGTVISRMLCPRRLDPETQYFAFLVPAFEIGRQACLGQDVSGLHHSDPAWVLTGPNKTAVPLTLPYYYRFQFTTSDAGDFESLVRALTPTVLKEGVGSRPMDVAHAEQNIPSAGPPLGLEGALRSVSTTPTDWKDPDKTAFQTAVQTFINQPSALHDDPANPIPDDPVIAPPIYGRWHAAVQSVDRTQPGWVNELNLDPRNRAAAGMGTQVVQSELTQLLASAWQQVDGVLAANQKLRQAQLARSALNQVYVQHFQIMQPDTALTLTAPLHARLMASPVTIRATVRASRVPERMLSPTFRRVTRPIRRLAVPGAPGSPVVPVVQRTSLLSRVNSGEVAIVPPPKPPDGMVSIDQVSDQLASPADKSLAANWRRWLALLILAVLVLAVIAGFALGIVAALVVIIAGVVAGVTLWNRAQAAVAKVALSNELHVSGFTSQTVASVPPAPSFQIEPVGTATPPAGAGTADSVAAAMFRSATSDYFSYVQALPVDPPQAAALDLAGLKTTLMLRLNPAVTVARRTSSLISLTSAIQWKPIDPIDPIMAAPEFVQPMYAPLRDLSEQYILPGVDLVPANSVGIVLANHSFIEAYMVGLNHEMARQLLWNDYPTDQRGSYFRQFWDVRAYVRQPGDPSDPAALAELLKDIPPIHTWPLPVPLGNHPNRTDIALNNVVLLVRGEIFKRYPNAVVFAAKAIRTGNTLDIDRNDDTNYKYPIFRGQLSKDITFLGFNLSADDARGGTADSPDGYFFVFQQQPSEPRFGLEPSELQSGVKNWAELAWTNFGGSKTGGGGAYHLPDLGNNTRALTVKNNPWRLASQVFSFTLSGANVPDILSPAKMPTRYTLTADPDNVADPNNQWGVNGAQTAYILLRLPFRVLIHSDLMLPSQ